MYNFTSFTVSLNELQTGMEKILAPTDCRLRPDIRSMENGNMGACLSTGQLGGRLGTAQHADCQHACFRGQPVGDQSLCK